MLIPITTLRPICIIIIIIIIISTEAHAPEYSQLLTTQNNNGFKLVSKPGEEVNQPDGSNLKPNSMKLVGNSREYVSNEERGVFHEVNSGENPSQMSNYKMPREDNSKQAKSLRHYKHRSRKVYPGQYADKRKNQNWKLWPEYMKSSVSPSDSNIAWSYWEEDENEEWEPDDADDSKTTPAPTTTTTTTTPAPTTTTTTTAAPTTTKAKPPVSIYKHFHYFKKAAPWKGDKDPATTMMPMEEMMKMPEEMMKMPEEMMMEMMMKGMMMMPPTPPTAEPDKKGGGLSGIFDKLSQVDPITVLVAGIVPASLILAAALPSVMNKMMVMNGFGMMIPMISTTAVSNGDMMGSRSNPSDTMASFIEAVREFGIKALEKPHCARKMFCKLAKDIIISDSPVIQRAVEFAAVAMEDSWLEYLGVRSILKSLNDNTCNQEDCEKDPTNFDST